MTSIQHVTRHTRAWTACVMWVVFFTGLVSQVQAEEVVIPPALLKQVDAGNADSAYFIASAFENGDFGIEQNLEKAKEWFLKSAEMGHVHGMYAFADMLFEEKLFAEAKDWYEKAAANGHGEAMYQMSLYSIYGLADHVFDCEAAYALFRDAQLRGVRPAFNDHAWMLATLPDKACRNGQKAWRIFSDLEASYGTTEAMPWAYWDTKAAVLAEIAEYNEAIEIQSWVSADFCEKDMPDDVAERQILVDRWMQELNEADDQMCYSAMQRLQQYMNRKPWRETPEFFL